MKWPNEVVLIRHGQSAYNILRSQKSRDPTYYEFVQAYKKDFQSLEAKKLAGIIWKKYRLSMGDAETPLTARGIEQAHRLGINLKTQITTPDIIFVSPYLRTMETLTHIMGGWPELSFSPLQIEKRIREQEHGLSLLYNDWRVFHVFHPEQKALYDLLGPYWYRYPQGESVADTEDRNRMMIDKMIRDYPEKNVLFITHHLTILSFRSLMERLTPKQFIELDEKEKPINCGVTIYKGNPMIGEDGKLELVCYNKKLF